MDLLTNEDRLEFKAAIKDVTDTFGKTEITYYRSKGSLDIYQEDQVSTVLISYALLAIAEEQKNEANTESKGGNWNFDKVLLTFNSKDLQAVELVSVDGTTHSLKSEVDYFDYQGQCFKVDEVRFDGAVDEAPVLVLVMGKRVSRPPIDFAEAIPYD